MIKYIVALYCIKLCAIHIRMPLVILKLYTFFEYDVGFSVVNYPIHI